MNANKILSYSIFYDDNNDKRFLPSLKNLAEDAKTTLYTILEHLENLDKLEFGKSYYNVVSEDYRCYDYVPFEAHNDWYGITPDAKQKQITALKFLKQYRIRAIFDISESTTVKEAKDIFLSPLIDHLLISPNILGTLFSINRISSEQVSLELFIFCDPVIEEKELEQMNLLLEKILAKNIWWFNPPYDYWFYRFYCEVFYNPNVLTASSTTFSFATKSHTYLKELSVNHIDSKGCSIVLIGYLLNSTMHSTFRHWLFTWTWAADWQKIKKFDTQDDNYVCCISTWDNPWDSVFKSDKIEIEQRLKEKKINAYNKWIQ